MKTVWIVAAVVIAAWLWCFRGPLASTEVLALRDAGNFYYPLFAWQDAQWSAGRIPLWNSLDGLGTPGFADATASVFYPGKLVFVLPLAFEHRFNLYLALHVLMAAGTLYFVARRWGASEIAAGVGALSYALGGYVLSQHCNVVFLISAAWLPLAFWLAESMLVRRSLWRALGFGATLAMMVYGGDPQTAYHAGLLAALLGLMIHWSGGAANEGADSQSAAAPRRGWNSPFVLLTVAAVSAFAYSAAQVLPAARWARDSDRGLTDVPHSLYEVGGYAFRDRPPGAPRPLPVVQAARRGLLGTPQAGTHARQMYHYSLGPWRLPELMWPNVMGSSYPVHRRWVAQIPAEGRAWMPTLYSGLIPWIAALTALRWKGAATRERWLLLCVLLGIAGSIGWYGIGWVVEELRWQLLRKPTEEPLIGPQVGGFYWLLTVILPGYSYFRYPAKWFVFAAAGLSFLAARGTDQLLSGSDRGVRIARAIHLISLAGAAILLLARRPVLNWLAAAPPDALYGPLDASGAWSDAWWGIVQTALLAGFVWWAVRRRLVSTTNRPIPAIVWLAITACELLLANQWIVASVPAELLHQPSQTATAARQLSQSELPPRVVHVGTISVNPEWSQSSHPQRLREIVAWERDRLLHRHHLAFGVASLDGPLSVRSAGWQQFLTSARLQYATGAGIHLQDLLRTVHVDAVITADGLKPLGSELPTRVTLVERGTSPTAGGRSSSEPLGTCRLVTYSPARIEVDCELQRPGVLIVSDAADPEWVARTYRAGESRGTPLVSQGAIVRALELPAGKQRVVLEYHPRLLVQGAIISLTSLLATLTLLVVAGFTKRRLLPPSLSGGLAPPGARLVS